MSKLERKYTWKHILAIVLVFVVAASVNLIPRQSTVSSPCLGAPGTKQSVNVTSRGWPLTYNKKYEVTSICLVYKDGKFVNGAKPVPESETNVFALLFNEVVILAGLLTIWWALSKAVPMLDKPKSNKTKKGEDE